MTCVAAISEKGRVYFAADSAGVFNLHLEVRADEKLFLNGPFLFGFTSSFRMGQLLRYRFKPPVQEESDDVTYMSSTFVEAVRDCLNRGGFAACKEAVEQGGTFMVGYKGNLYVVYDDYQVFLPSQTFHAVGCGADLALGALFVQQDLSSGWPHGIHRSLNHALLAAETYSAGVRAPFRYLES